MQTHVLTHPTLTHPHTGLPLRAIAYGKRGPIWPILGASDDDGSGDGGGSDAGTRTATDWKPPASQADLDRIIQQRLDRERTKLTSQFSDYDSLKEKADQWEALAAASQTDTERAVREAQETAWNAAMAQTVPRVVTAEFRAEAKGLLSPEQLDAILEDLDLTKYANDDGEPDVERIRNKIAVLAPVKGDERQRRGPSPEGHGRRESTTTGSSVASGRDLYRARHQKTT